MPERFLRKNDLAARFQTSWEKAAGILREHGVWPLDLGRGRGNGCRWLESDVDSVLRKLAFNTRPTEKRPKPARAKAPPVPLAAMSTSQIMEMLSPKNLQ